MLSLILAATAIAPAAGSVVDDFATQGYYRIVSRSTTTDNAYCITTSNYQADAHVFTAAVYPCYDEPFLTYWQWDYNTANRSLHLNTLGSDFCLDGSGGTVMARVCDGSPAQQFLVLPATIRDWNKQDRCMEKGGEQSPGVYALSMVDCREGEGGEWQEFHYLGLGP